MAVVAIEVEVDDKGAIEGVDKVSRDFKVLEAGANRAGDAGTTAFKGITKESSRAGAATSLVARQLGITLPASVQKFLASSSLIGPAMSAAFNVSIIMAVGAAVVALIPKIRSLADLWGGYTQAVKDAYAEQVKLNDAILTGFDDRKVGRFLVNQTNARLSQLSMERDAILGTQMTWKEYVQAVTAGNISAIAATSISLAQREKLGEIYEEEAKLQRRQMEQLKLLGELEKKANEDAATSAKKSFDERAQAAKQLGEISSQWSKRGLSETGQLNEEFVQAYQKALVEAQRSGLGRAEIEKQLAELVAGYSRQHGKIAEDEADKRIKADQEAFKKRKELEDQELEARRSREHERASMAEAGAQMEAQAAELALPPWQRAFAEIAAAHDHTVRQINAREQDLLQNVEQHSDEWVRIETTAQAARLAADHLTNERIMDEHRRLIEEQGQQWESLFDDITSGNIGKRILSNIKKLFFQIFAAWMSTTKGMGNTTAGGGGLLGGLIFGNAGGMPGGMGGGLSIPGMGGIVSGGGAAGAATGGSSIGGVSGSPIIPVSGFLPGALTTSQSGAVLGGSAAGGSASGSAGGGILGTLLGSVFGGGKSSGGSASGGLGSRLATGGVTLAKSLGPMAAMAAGGKFGGTAGALGVGLSTLGIMAAAGNAQALAAVSALGLAPALLAGVGGGLLGFGVGMQHGKTAGAITGVAGGLGTAGIMAMLGVSMGPIGWIAAGAIGLLGGIFGGIFGGKKRRRQAEAIASKALPQINSLVDAYKTHQLDGASALQQLDAMQQSLWEQMHQLKGEGDKVYTQQMLPKLLTARAEIQMYETERGRRDRLDFSPPMFHSGGYVEGGPLAGWRASNGELLAVLKEGEFVSNPRSTAKNRGVLEAMNKGENFSGGGGGDIINLSFVDGASFGRMLRNAGGWEAFKAESKRRTREGDGL